MIYNTQITYLMLLTRYRGGKLEDHCSSCCLPSGSMYLSYPRDMVVFNCLITFLLYYRIMLLLVLVYHIRHYLQFDMHIAMVCQNFENKSVSVSSTILVVTT